MLGFNPASAKSGQIYFRFDLSVYPQNSIDKHLKFQVENKSLAFPSPLHLAPSSPTIIDSVSPATVSRVCRNFLNYSVIQGGVQRPIEMLAMDVRPDVKKCTPQSKHLELILGRCVCGVLSVSEGALANSGLDE
jgi:hypothetical protein